MWLNLRKAGFHAHKSKIHFSPLNDRRTHWITTQASIDAESLPVDFVVACFKGLSEVHKCSGHLQMAPHSLDKQTAACNSPHNWLMSLAMDFADWCDMWRWKWHQRMPFGWFWWRHSLYPPLCGYLTTPTLLPYRSATGIGYIIKNYLKWWEI